MASPGYSWLPRRLSGLLLGASLFFAGPCAAFAQSLSGGGMESEYGAFLSASRMNMMLGPFYQGAIVSAGVSVMLVTLVGSAYASLKAVRGDEGFIPALMYAIVGVGVAVVLWMGITVAVPWASPHQAVGWFIEGFGGRGQAGLDSVAEQVIGAISICSFILGVVVVAWGGGKSAAVLLQGGDGWVKQFAFAIAGYFICFSACGVYYFTNKWRPGSVAWENPGGEVPFDYTIFKD